MSGLDDHFRSNAHWNLAESDFAADLQQADNALTVEPRTDDALMRKTVALLGLDRYDEALPIALQLVEDHVDSSTAWLLLCRALRGLGYDELAMLANAVITARATHDFETDRFGGDTLFDSERFEEASAAYQPALQRWGEDPWAWELWYNVAACLEEAGRSADARSASEHALRLLQQVRARNNAATEKQHATLLNALGILYFRLGRYPQAKRALSDSAVADGRGTAIYWLARTHREEGHALAALPLFFWLLRNLWADDRARRDNRGRMIEQRVALTPERQQRIEALIAREAPTIGAVS